ncbi:MAG: formyltransferase family protein, partial [Candidatus Omnitrophota bacterium]
VSKLGFLNMHPSYLPYNRGKHYYFWNIVEEVPFGVSLHFINEAVDSGDIAFQKEIKTRWEDSGFTLRERSKSEIVKLFEEKFDEIVSNRISRIKQDLDKGTFHLEKDLEEGSRVDLNRKYTARELLNILRARSGFGRGGSWFEENGEKYEVDIRIKNKDGENG